jgi:hypothetical protein
MLSADETDFVSCSACWIACAPTIDNREGGELDNYINLVALG